jgi:hypothetical protein
MKDAISTARRKQWRPRSRKPDARARAIMAGFSFVPGDAAPPAWLPTGRKVLSASFEREGDTMPAEGTLTLHVGDRTVGQGRIKTQPGKFSIAGEGLNVGQDSSEPVTTDYPGQAPWPFTGGTIHRALGGWPGGCLSWRGCPGTSAAGRLSRPGGLG